MSTNFNLLSIEDRLPKHSPCPLEVRKDGFFVSGMFCRECHFSLSGSRLPLDSQPLSTRGAFTQIEIDQRLVRNTHLVRERLEVVERTVINPNRDLPLQALRVGVRLCLGKIVSLSHRLHLRLYWAHSDRSAFHAEMIRITSSSSR